MRLSVVLDEGREHQEQRVRAGESVLVVGAVVVDDDVLVGALLERLLALASGGEIGQRDFALLQPPAVESVRAVDVDGARDVAHVVRDERAAVDDHEGPVARPRRLQPLLEALRLHDVHFAQDEGSLQRPTLGARARGQTHA